MEEYERRLPVYLLLDCSGSMAGEPIVAVRQGIRALLTDLKSDPQALETAWLSVILFGSTARQIIPLTQLIKWKEPVIEAGGVSGLGAALKLLECCIEREVKKTTQHQKGDWEPLVFILTDGTPTDEWQESINSLKAHHSITIVACGAGANANTAVLKQITDSVVMMNTLSAGDLAHYFAWFSAIAK